MCMMKPPKMPKIPERDKPRADNSRATAARQQELARAAPARLALMASGPLGVPNYSGGASAALTGVT